MSKVIAKFDKTVISELAANSLDMWFVDPRKTEVIENWNPRVQDEEHIQSLQRSMEFNGYDIDKPLAGFLAVVNGENKLFIYDGGSRRKAAIRGIDAGTVSFKTVPVTVSKVLSDAPEELKMLIVSKALLATNACTILQKHGEHALDVAKAALEKPE